MEPYEYAPLNENEIRLVRILPGAEDDRVSLEIRHVSLENLPRYGAVSYSWGPDAAGLELAIEGKRVAIRPNLDALLREFRVRPSWYVPDKQPDRSMAAIESLHALLEQCELPENQTLLDVIEKVHEFQAITANAKATVKEGEKFTESQQKTLNDDMKRVMDAAEELWNSYATDEGLPKMFQERYYLWIDAICINQSDPDEKAQQIRLMQTIYKEASCLSVWLGERDSFSSMAFTNLQKLADKGVVSGSKFNIDDTFTPEEQEEAWLGISMLLSRSWFSRMWILQEHTFGPYRPGNNPRRIADRAVFSCGKDRMKNLVEVSVHAMYHKLQHTRERSSVGALADFWRVKMIRLMGILNLSKDYRTTRASSSPPKLRPNQYQIVPMLMRARMAETTDPRDRIYSLLGLAEELFRGTPSDLAPEHLIVDYTASVQDVYASFVRSVVHATQRLDILGFCTPHTRKRPDSSVKGSWVPDWTQSKEIAGMLATDVLNSDSSDFQALTYDATPDRKCDVQFAPDLTTLTIKGISWGRIGVVSSTLDLSDESGGNGAAFKSECSNILRMAAQYRASDKEGPPDLEKCLLKALVTTRRLESRGELHIDDWQECFIEWLAGATTTHQADASLITSDGAPTKEAMVQHAMESASLSNFEESDSDLASRIKKLALEVAVIETYIAQADDPNSTEIKEIKAAMESAQRKIGEVKKTAARMQLREDMVAQKPLAESIFAVTLAKLGLGSKAVASLSSPEGNALATAGDGVKHAFNAALQRAMQPSPRIFVTENGYIGRGNTHIKYGDYVCVILGCALPLVLRPIDEDGQCELVSEAFVPEIMHGEALTAVEQGKMMYRTFELH